MSDGQADQAGVDQGAGVVLPDWVGYVLNPTSDQYMSRDIDDIGQERTVRGEFVRRVRRAGLETDEGPVLRAGLAALDGRLREEPLPDTGRH